MNHVKLLSYCSHGHWQSMAIGKYQKYHVQFGGLVDRIGLEVCFSRWVFFFIEKVFVQELLRTLDFGRHKEE